VVFDPILLTLVGAGPGRYSQIRRIQERAWQARKSGDPRQIPPRDRASEAGASNNFSFGSNVINLFSHGKGENERY